MLSADNISAHFKLKIQKAKHETNNRRSKAKQSEAKRGKTRQNVAKWGKVKVKLDINLIQLAKWAQSVGYGRGWLLTLSLSAANERASTTFSIFIYFHVSFFPERLFWLFSPLSLSLSLWLAYGNWRAAGVRIFEICFDFAMQQRQAARVGAGWSLLMKIDQHGAGHYCHLANLLWWLCCCFN